jgi:stringent starvation protein B
MTEEISNIFLARQRKLLLERLLEGDHVLLHIAPTFEGVKIPESLQRQQSVTLKVSWKFQGKMELKATCVSALLKFSEGYRLCEIPYGAIWAVTDESGKSMMLADNSKPSSAQNGQPEKSSTSKLAESASEPATALIDDETEGGSFFKDSVSKDSATKDTAAEPGADSSDSASGSTKSATPKSKKSNLKTMLRRVK